MFYNLSWKGNIPVISLGSEMCMFHVSLSLTQCKTTSYFELSADFLRLKSDRCLLADFKIPGAKNLYCQIPIRLEDMKTSPKGLGHAAEEQHSHETQHIWTKIK